MFAVTCDTPCAAEHLRLSEVEKPSLSSNEILIRVMAAGVNPADIEQRKGLYGPPPGVTPILGLEVSGYIVEKGKKVDEVQLGDKVMALLPGGGYAEFAKVDSRLAIKIPADEEISFVEAAALPEGLFTAWKNLVIDGKLKPKEKVLIHGATGGVGSLAVQIAKSMGAIVIGTTRTIDKAAHLKDLGCDLVVNTKEESFEQFILNRFPEGVDVILDFLGGESFPKNLKILGFNGRLIHIDCILGEVTTLNIGDLIDKNLTISGSLLKPLSHDEKAKISFGIKQHLVPLIFSDNTSKIKPVVDRVFPVTKIGDAHNYLETSKTRTGKVVIDMTTK